MVKKKTAKRSRPGFIYLIKSHDGYYKIGKTINIERRIRDLSTAMPLPAQLVHVITTDDTGKTEKYLHDLFWEGRTRGEWFDLGPSDVAWMQSVPAYYWHRSILDEPR